MLRSAYDVERSLTAMAKGVRDVTRAERLRLELDSQAEPQEAPRPIEVVQRAPLPVVGRQR